MGINGGTNVKVQINIVAGFLEAGKTTFIRTLLQNSQFRDGKNTVLICCEQGIEEYNDKRLELSNVTLVNVDDISEMTNDLFKSIIENYSPDRILIEYNGTWEIGEILKTSLPTRCYINKIIFLADASTFQIYMSNMGSILSEQLSNSDLVLLNRDSSLAEFSKKQIKRTVKNINRTAEIAFYKKTIAEKYINQIMDVDEVQGLYKAIRGFLVIIPFLMLYLFLISIKQADFNNNYAKVQTLNTIFISILIQAIPFILIGVFISSLLQVFVSDNIMVRLFTRNKFLGYPLAILTGMCFPVCDCAMAPITARLVRKGVPVHYAVTFMLAAPAVNPIVITSTAYAFPNSSKIVFMRIIIGIIVSVMAGVFIKIGGITKEYSVNESSIDNVCASGYLGNIYEKGLLGKVEAVFRHAGLEFLNVTKFVVLGAFITAILQSTVSKAALETIGGTRPILVLFIMLLAATLMSVCSSSNAFIARSFSYNFPTYSVLAYMVMGPMLDLKNLLMLSSGFKKKFIAELVFLLVIIAIFVFSILAMII